MSNLVEVKVPDVGGATDLDVIEVLIKPGDVVENEQTLAVLESDKATMDMPSSTAGTVQEVKVAVGDKVSENSLIALLEIVEQKASSTETKPEAAELPVTEVKPEKIAEKPQAAEVSPAEIPEVKKAEAAQAPVEISSSTDLPHATPGIRRFARELGVDLGRIIKGSGRKGRILKEDVKAFVKQVMTKGSEQGGGAAIPSIPGVDFSQFGEIEERQLSKIKRLTGQNMTRVWLNLPMVTHHDESDITELEAFRKALNGEKREVKLTVLVFIMKALVAALKKMPEFNSSLSADGQSLIFKHYFNIGIAVDTPNGLTVPVIRDVDKKSIDELSIELGELSEKARSGKLMPTDMQGGCMTISSLGGIGGTAFTPIVNAPEVAILGVTRAAMKPVWDGQQFLPRLMLPLDLSYDHRVIDGAAAARFMAMIANYLSDIRRILL